MILLALGVLAALVAFLLGSPGTAVRRARFILLLAIYFLPALFLAGMFHRHQDEILRFRFSLLGFGFRSGPGERMTIDVGGDRDQSAVWVSALRDRRFGAAPAGRLLFLPGRGDQGRSRVLLEPVRGPAAGFFGLRRDGSRLAPLGAVRLESGDRLTIAGRTWTIELHSELLGLGSPATLRDDEGHVVALPRRESEVPLVVTQLKIPIGRPRPASQETYSLAYLEKVATGALPSPLPRAFLFRLPGLLRDGGIYLASPDGSVAIERGGQLLEMPVRIPLASGDALHVLSFPVWGEQQLAAGGLRDRRSFRLGVAQRGFTLELDTKEVQALPWRKATPQDRQIGLEDLAILPPDGDGKGEPLRVSLAMGPWQFVDKSLHFTHVSRRVAAEALAVLELPRDPGRAGEEYTAATPRGQGRGLFGKPVWLGGETLAAVQLDIVRAPVGLGVLALVMALFKAMAARAARWTNAHAVFAVALEALVTLRVLLAFRAWAMPPFSDEAFRLAMIAWMLVPWGFLAVSLGRVRLRRDDEGEGPTLVESLPVFAGLMASAAWCFQFSGGGGRGLVWVACHGLLALLPTLLPGFAAAVRFVSRLVARWGHRLVAWMERRASRRLEPLLQAARSSESLPWVLLALVPAVLRLGLFLVGAKESLPLPNQRFALTLLHVPLTVVLQAGYLAWLWRQVLRRGGMEVRDLLPALFFVLGAWAFPAFLVSDLGLALLNIPIFLLALVLLSIAALRHLRETGDGWRRLGTAPALSLGALALCLLFTASPAGARLVNRAVTFFNGEETVERNYLRVLAFAYPDQLGRIARRSSEELAVMNRVMSSYTSRPVLECRYFSSELSPHLRATTLREHVVAVLLAAEWTVAGVIGALLLYWTAGAAGVALAPWRLRDGTADPEGIWASPSFFRITALLAALTFALPSIYMILANYRLTLFTGKNVYLLGLDSNADVLEVLALAALFALAVSAVRDAEETW